MPIVAKQFEGKISDTYFDPCHAAFRLPVASTVNTKHRFYFKYFVCVLRSVSVLRRTGSLLPRAGTRSTSAFTPSLHAQLLLIVTRNVRLNKVSERPRSPRCGYKPKFKKRQITHLRCNALLSRSSALVFFQPVSNVGITGRSSTF